MSEQRWMIQPNMTTRHIYEGEECDRLGCKPVGEETLTHFAIWNAAEGGEEIVPMTPIPEPPIPSEFVEFVKERMEQSENKECEGCDECRGSNEEVRVTSETGGSKGAKLARLGSLDPLAILEVAKVAGFGEIKYSRLNYMNGYAWSLSFDAMLRHLFAFWSGEDIDPESGLPHLAHAAWHCLCLLAFMREYPEYDDRYKR